VISKISPAQTILSSQAFLPKFTFNTLFLYFSQFQLTFTASQDAVERSRFLTFSGEVLSIA
jgi:hypothetical protein